MSIMVPLINWIKNYLQLNEVFYWHHIYMNKVTNENNMKTDTLLKVVDQQLLKLLKADLAQFVAKKTTVNPLPKAA